MHSSNCRTIYEEDRSKRLRKFFASYVAKRGGANDGRIEEAFASVPREPFAGPPPWFIIGPLSFFPAIATYTPTPDGDPAYLYQDVLIALDPQRGVNIGDPSFHAFCLAALAIREGEAILHVGCGSGYYTAIMAHLVGPSGRIHAFEIDPAIAPRAKANLASYPMVDLHERSGVDTDLPAADAIYVNAAFTQPVTSWLEALKPGGRLLFPLQRARSLGGMLLVQRPLRPASAWPARIITRSMFIAGHGSHDAGAGRRLDDAFASTGTWQHIRSLRFDAPSDQSCWLRGDEWWLSTADGPNNCGRK